MDLDLPFSVRDEELARQYKCNNFLAQKVLFKRCQIYTKYLLKLLRAELQIDYLSEIEIDEITKTGLERSVIAFQPGLNPFKTFYMIVCKFYVKHEVYKDLCSQALDVTEYCGLINSEFELEKIEDKSISDPRENCLIKYIDEFIKSSKLSTQNGEIRKEVVLLKVKGLNAREIAEEMNASISTIRRILCDRETKILLQRVLNVLR